MSIKIISLSVCIAAFLWSCEENVPGTGAGTTQKEKNSGGDDWTIPVNEVYDGGPGKDGIPSLDDPDFIPVEDVDFLDDGDLVLGYKKGDEVRAYPHAILNWHEIVNDQVGNAYLSVTYCPLTGTGIGWNRCINGEVTTFGVSGLLYNTNLIPYDRLTDSNWSQILGESVEGELASQKIGTHQLIEVPWNTWKKMYPSSKVLSTKTGYTRSYSTYPYGSYLTNNDFLIFPVSNSDDRLPNKERVHGITVSGNTRVYPFSLFEELIVVRQEHIKDNEFVITGSKEDNFIVSYYADPGDGTILWFSAVQDKYPVVMTDQENNLWDVFGKAVSGPREGVQLQHSGGFMGFWLAFAAFYPESEIAGSS